MNNYAIHLPATEEIIGNGEVVISDASHTPPARKEMDELSTDELWLLPVSIAKEGRLNYYNALDKYAQQCKNTLPPRNH